MATGTVDRSPPTEVQGPSSTAPRSPVEVRSDPIPKQEEPAVTSPRLTPMHQRRLSPFVITDRPEEKQLGLSSRSLSLQDFRLLKTLGTGTFARVWLVNLKNPQERRNQVYALKILRKADVIKLKQVEHVRNERKTLAAVSGYPFITALIATFADDQSLNMLLEYCPGGEIFSYLRRARRFNENTSRFYAAEICLTIEYLHDVEGVVYRDLKPENILLDAEGHIKLVDFGFAKQIGDRETYTLCGTPEYLAPEVIHNSGHGLAVDWWALGILIYEFLVGQPPFWDQNPMRIYEQIVEGHIRYPQGMGGAAQNIISLLCKTNPTERLGYISGGSSRVKAHPFFEGINWDDLFHRRTKGPILPRVDHPADTGNFEEYPDPDVRNQAVYSEDLKKKYEALFGDF
ncbi:putative camp-dependent protein kinase catalytic subunit [Aspergillus taichungensis]|uniref:cAMP-dependent protein kinase n=1 Tax=Aspergillus taichungensis TaxID=482145 RepID=A0A2J5HFD4_9EURO|nr:putative camp-dependent protein kinase catalytic subunit [Aspergillus taichungensis]